MWAWKQPSSKELRAEVKPYIASMAWTRFKVLNLHFLK